MVKGYDLEERGGFAGVSELQTVEPHGHEQIAPLSVVAADRRPRGSRVRSLLFVATSTSHGPATRIVERRMRLYDYEASGNCFKVRLLLGLLGVNYERIPVNIFAGGTLSTPEFAELNPLRETPVLETDDGSVLAQSNAILWYLGEGTRYMPQTALRARRGGPVALLRAGARHVGDRKRPLPHHDRAWSRRRPGTARARKDSPRGTRLAAPGAALPGRRPVLDRGHLQLRVHPCGSRRGLRPRRLPGRRALARPRRGRARLCRRPSWPIRTTRERAESRSIYDG